MNSRLLEQCRKRYGKQFRKQIGQFNYKVKTYQIDVSKNPGAIPLKTKVELLKVSYWVYEARNNPRSSEDPGVGEEVLLPLRKVYQIW